MADIYVTKKEICEKLKLYYEKYLKQFQDKSIVLIGILNNALVFTMDLLHTINTKLVEIDFLYIKNNNKTFTITDIKQETLSGKHVILLTGILFDNMNLVIEKIQAKNPEQISVLSLFKTKNYQPNFACRLDYLYQLNTQKMIGYGLDIGDNFNDFNNVYFK